jgi:NAD(P)H-flavin reductase
MSTDRDPDEAKEEGGAPSSHGVVPTPVRVSRVRREMAGVTTLELTPASAFGFAPGQFNMLYMFGLGEVAISLSGDPAEDHRIVHTVRGVGAVSQAIIGLRRNDVIGVRGPYGSYWPVLDSEGSDVVIVAGGLGLAPLRPVIYRVLAHRERYGRVVVLYGARGRPTSFIDGNSKHGEGASMSTSQSRSITPRQIGGVMSAWYRL